MFLLTNLLIWHVSVQKRTLRLKFDLRSVRLKLTQGTDSGFFAHSSDNRLVRLAYARTLGTFTLKK